MNRRRCLTNALVQATVKRRSGVQQSLLRGLQLPQTLGLATVAAWTEVQLDQLFTAMPGPQVL